MGTTTASGHSEPVQKKKRLRVGVCIDTRDGPGRERLLGVYQYAKERDWQLFLVRGVDARARRLLTELQLDGAIFYDRPAPFQRFAKGLGIICVETGARNLEHDDAAVFADDAAITRMAADHLASAGFRNLAYCGLAKSHPSSLRAVSFAEHARRLALSASTFEDSHAEGGAELGSLIRWLNKLPKPVGILAFDDKMAERVVTGCQWADIAVPDAVGVLGIGDDELICELGSPPLSSVAVATGEIGRLSAVMLESLWDRRELPKRFLAVSPVEIVARTSTSRLPPVHPSVSTAIEYMRAKLSSSIGTDQVARAVGMPRRTLERHFRRDLGRTVHDFLVELRLGHAKHLLRQSESAMGDVARHCGYSGLSAFRQMFFAQVGCYPEAYREIHHTRRTIASRAGTVL